MDQYGYLVGYGYKGRVEDGEIQRFENEGAYNEYYKEMKGEDDDGRVDEQLK